VNIRKQIIVATLVFLCGAAAQAQPPGPLPGPPLPGPPGPRDDLFFRHRPAHLRDYSLIFLDAPEPREIQVHDIITIMVDEKSEVTMNSRFNRQRNSSLKAELKDFIRLNDGNLDNAADNEPTIEGNLQKRSQSNGQLSDQEGIRYRIAAMVVDVRPNGNLVLEARKTIRTNKDLWEYTLTGEIPSRAINRDMTALSENVYALSIDKKLRGKVYDATRRPWGAWLYDKFFPF
jgi:flagellar L-ring protein precursor FlgH